jgi:hypothetical protein
VIDTSGNVGIATTAPYARLGVGGAVAAEYFNADNTSATSTLSGGLNVSNGALTHDFSAGLTSIQNLSIGAMTFDTNAGTVSWVDMPVTSAATPGTIQSYTAQLDGSPILTVYSVSNGTGGIASSSVGIASTTPWGTFSVEMQPTTTVQFVVSDSGTTTPALLVDGRGFTSLGSTTPWGKFSIDASANGTAPFFTIASSTATRFIVSAAGRVGIATDTPGTTLSVNGNGVVAGELYARTFQATSTAAASTFTYASSTYISVSGTASTSQLTISGIANASTQCLQLSSTGVVSGTGSACGSGGAGDSKWATTTGAFVGITPNSAAVVGIGTSTPRALLHLSTSTASQLVLSDEYAGTNPWALRTINGNFYLSTTSADTFATSTTASFRAASGLFSFLGGNVGIGTESPSDKLHVEGSSGLDGATPVTIRLNTSNNGTWTDESIMSQILFNSSDISSGAGTRAAIKAYVDDTAGADAGLSFYTTTGGATGIAERARIDHVGNFGIGTTTPGTRLSVNGDAVISNFLTARAFTATSTSEANTFTYASSTYISVSDTASTSQLVISGIANASTQCLQLSSTGVVSGTGSACGSGGAGDSKWATTTGAFVGIATNAASVVGIGTSTPRALLHLSTTSPAALAISDGFSTASTWIFRSAPDAFYLATTNPSTMATSTIAQLVIDSNGNVGLGTNAPSAKLQVAGLASTTNLTVSGIAAANGAGCLQINNLGVVSGTGAGCGSGSSPAAPSGSIQFNNGGVLGGSSNLMWDNTNSVLSISTSTPTLGAFAVESGTARTVNSAFTGDIDNFMEVHIANINAGTAASSDLVLQNNLGTTSPNSGGTYYLDLGIKSSNYNQAAFSALGANDGYLYSSDAALAIGTASTTNQKASLEFFTGGTTAANERMRIAQGGFVGIGTTSPQFTLQIASSTAPQLALSDGTLTSNHWSFRNAGGNLYIGTSTASTFSTTTGTVGGLNIIGSTGNVGIGTSSPFAKLSVVGGGVSTNDSYPSFMVATTSQLSGSLGSRPLLWVSATTTGKLDYARVAIGMTSAWGNAGLRDQLTVDGRIYSTWRYMGCDFLGAGLPSASGLSADMTAAAGGNICGSLTFDEDVDGGIIALHASYPIAELRSSDLTGQLVGDGAILRTVEELVSATSSPIMEVWGLASSTLGATSTPLYMIGFSNLNWGATPTESLPNDGVYFIASTSASGNWIAVTRSGGVDRSWTNTGVKATSTAGAYDFALLKFRIELSDQRVVFLINGTVVAEHTGTIPSASMSAVMMSNILAGNGNVNLAPRLWLSTFRLWMDDPPSGTVFGDGESPLDFFDPIEGADVAEAYLADGPARYVPGIIVANSTTTQNGVRFAKGRYDADIMGAITVSPRTVLGDEASTTVRVGLVGRVPVIVSTENGIIKKGDRVTSSLIEGIGMRASRPGAVIGRALQDMPVDENDKPICQPFLVEELEGAGVTLPDDICIQRVMVYLDAGTDMSIGSILQDIGEGAADIALAIAELANTAFTEGAELTKFVVGQVVAKVAIVGDIFTKGITILPGGKIVIPGGEGEISGWSMLTTGTTSVFVSNAGVSETSKVFITPRGLLASPLAVTAITPGVGFEVGTLSAPESDVPFDWFIVTSYGDGGAPSSPAGSPPPPESPPEEPPPSEEPPAENPPQEPPQGGSGGEAPPVETPPGDVPPAEEPPPETPPEEIPPAEEPPPQAPPESGEGTAEGGETPPQGG